MAFRIDDGHLPVVLTVGPLTDEEFAGFCAEHEDLSLEVTADGRLIVMPLPPTLTGARNSAICVQLENWAWQDGCGMAFDSSTGYVLPNGARRSPDASWVRSERIDRLDPSIVKRFWRLGPDFVIELKSDSDRIRTLREKMVEWISNGAELAWLIDPETRTVEIYRPGMEPEAVTGAARIEGTGPVDGFVLDLARVWDPRMRRC